MAMLDCNTILCLQNQMPDVGMDDLFIVGYLVIGTAIVIYLVIDALKEAIKEYVLDHYEHFGAYPMEVETDTQVYTFDQYWAILDKEN
jgi:hypothetical protein